MHKLSPGCQHLAAIHHLQGIPFGTDKTAFSDITVYIDIRVFKLRQIANATHIHLAAQRQNTRSGIADGRFQRQQAVVLHQNATGSCRCQGI